MSSCQTWFSSKDTIRCDEADFPIISDVLHLSMHSIDVCVIGFLDPFLWRLARLHPRFPIACVGPYSGWCLVGVQP